MENVATLKTARRILMAFANRTLPAAVDIEELRRLAPEYADRPIGDVARKIVEQRYSIERN